jgi:Twin arginine targeting (Tat) protein translocase TatC
VSNAQEVEDDEGKGGQTGFISHLVELRDRLIKAAVAVVAIFVVLFLYPGASVIYDFLAQPMLATLPPGTRMIATGVITPFMVPVKVTMLAAFILALPFVLYQVWAFVAPGLYRNEQRLAIPLIVSSSLLFLVGMAFCYFIVFKTVFAFISSFAPQSITPAPDIEAYLNFVMSMFLAFGITFEVPVVVVLLVRMGMVSVKKLREIRGYVVVVAFVIAAIVTPPDVISQFMLAVPLWVLYEVGLIVASRVTPRAADPDDADDTDDIDGDGSNASSARSKKSNKPD